MKSSLRFLPLGLVLALPSSPQAGEFTNAADSKFGGSITTSAGAGAKVDATTTPAELTDGNVHTRQVFTGAPYTITIQLMEKVPVEKLAFANSDYAKEMAPEDVEISLDGGAPLKHKFALQRPEKKRQPVWQEIPVGQAVQKIEIKVLSNQGGEGTVNWGGFGEIAVLTKEDLGAKFTVAGYDAASPTFVHAAGESPSAASAPKAKLPPRAAAGEYPRLLFTPKELAEFKETVTKTEKGKASYEFLISLANGAVKKDPQFPSVEDTVANKAGKEHSNLSYAAHATGLAYALTGDEKYAKACRDILVGYAQRYADYPQHSGRNKADSSKITFQRLSEAMWLIPHLEGYDYIHHSKSLSASDRELIETKLIRAAIEEIRRKTPAQEVADRDKKTPGWREQTPEPAERGHFPNWLTFYNTATMMAGSLMDDRNMMDLAAADLRAAIATGIGADGMWGEGAIGYQLFAMGVMAPGFEAAARQGIDLWNSSNGRFKQLFDSPLRYAYPDGTMPGINDSERAKMGSWQSMVYDYGYARYGDPAYTFIINSSPRQINLTEGIYEPTLYYTDLPEPPSVKATSTLFGSLGYAIQRDDTKYALIDYGPHGGVHGHYDKLNLLLFAGAAGQKGDEMGGEPKFFHYADKQHDTWTVQTVAHNTMTVGEKSQLAGEGRLLVYENTPTISVMRAESASSYPGVLLDRTVVSLRGLVLDLYTGRSAVATTFDRTFLYHGALDGAGTGGEPLGSGAGYQHLKVASRQPAVSGPWRGSWSTKAGAFQVTVAGSPGQETIATKGPEDVDLVLMRQQGKEAAFAAAYQLGAWGGPLASLEWKEGAEGVRVCEAKRADGSSILVFIGNGGAWSAQGWESDARVLVVSGSAEKQVLMTGGTLAQSGAATVKLAQPGNALATGTSSALQLVSSWSPTK